MNGDELNRYYERRWAGSRCIDVTHFYSISTPEDVDRDGYERFAYGYYTHDGIFCQGVTHFDGEGFSSPSGLEQAPVR